MIYAILMNNADERQKVAATFADAAFKTANKITDTMDDQDVLLVRSEMRQANELSKVLTPLLAAEGPENRLWIVKVDRDYQSRSSAATAWMEKAFASETSGPHIPQIPANALTLDQLIVREDAQWRFNSIAQTVLFDRALGRIQSDPDVLSAPPADILISGDAGSGKTALAQAIALKMPKAGIVPDKAPSCIIEAHGLANFGPVDFEMALQNAFGSRREGVLVVRRLDELLDSAKYGQTLNRLFDYMQYTRPRPTIVATFDTSEKWALPNADIHFRHHMPLNAYTDKELVRIFSQMAELSQMKLGENTLDAVSGILARTNSNAHAVDGIFARAKIAMAARLAKTGADLSGSAALAPESLIITPQDITNEDEGMRSITGRAPRMIHIGAKPQ